jgi:hypothetical protein
MNGASKNASDGDQRAAQTLHNGTDEIGEDPGSDLDIGALLREIQVANGVELKLDNLIDQLDTILQKLEGDTNQRETSQVQPGSASNSTSSSYKQFFAAGS